VSADLFGHHRESASLLAGAGGFDRRVQREEVRLLGDCGDRGDDRSDLL
jgi:hypothetical protein